MSNLDAAGKIKENGIEVCPIGIILPYGGNNTPNGWLLCDGSMKNISDYPELYAVIGNNYAGGQSQSGAFRLPHLSDRRYLCGSTVPGTYYDPGLPNITGTIAGDRFPPYWGDGSNGAFSWAENTANGACQYDNSHRSQKITFNANKSNSIYGNSSTVRPLSATVRFIIRAK